LAGPLTSAKCPIGDPLIITSKTERAFDSRHRHVRGFFEDFHSITFTDQKRPKVAAKLLAITTLCSPFSSVEDRLPRRGIVRFTL
jgi:hypothetical protein